MSALFRLFALAVLAPADLLGRLAQAFDTPDRSDRPIT